MGKQMTRIQRQRLECILPLRTEIDDNLEYIWGYPQVIAIIKKVQGYAMLIVLPQSRTNVSLFESDSKVVEARMLCDKCIENWFWSYSTTATSKHRRDMT